MIDLMSVSFAFSLTATVLPPDPHGCPERPHTDHEYCECVRVVDFYRPVGPGAPIRISPPGIRVIGRPVEVAGPVVHIAGPPVYVDAPPVRVRPAQIFIERPEVIVRPSEVIIDPPEVRFADCRDRTDCVAPE